MLKSRPARLGLLVIGVTTPIGILVVNGAAFVMRHLAEFRLAIAACALISSLVLNGLTAWWILRLARRRAASFYDTYRPWVLALVVLVVIASSVGAAYFTHIGMRDPARMPDSLAVLTALLALTVPFTITYIGRRLAGLKGLPAPLDEPTKSSPPRRSGFHEHGPRYRDRGSVG